MGQIFIKMYVFVFVPVHKHMQEKKTFSSSFFSVDLIKKKFKNLRTTFGRERERVEESKRSGGGGDEVFVPKWKHYKDLLFLNSGTISVVLSTDKPCLTKSIVTLPEYYSSKSEQLSIITVLK